MTTLDTRPPTGEEPTTRRPFSKTFQRHPLLMLGGIWIVLIIVTGIVQPNYISFGGMRNMVLIAAPLGIMAGAQTILMLTGGIDLSVGMIATAAAYFAAFQTNGWAAILVGLGVAAVIGFVNGVGVGVFKVNPLIMTLAMSAILVGTLTYLAQNVFRGSARPAGIITTIGAGSIFGGRLPWSAVLWAGIAVGIIFMLRRTGFGRLLYASGDNPVAVRLSGVRLWQVHILAYTIAGVLAGIAGILLLGRLGAADLSLAANDLLPSVAAAVIGGTSIFGGMGTYSGTIMGALILSVLQSLLGFLQTGQAVQNIVYGSIVLALAWIYASTTRSR
jgi:ribose transport system permease protein